MPAFALLLTALVACSARAPADRVKPAPFSACKASEADPYKIKKRGTEAPVRVQGDTLYVDVEHGGGCETHEYQICWPTGEFEGTEPTRVALEVWHNSNQDKCRALARKSLPFDLTPLKEAWRAKHGADAGTLQIRLGGKSVDYTFGPEAADHP